LRYLIDQFLSKIIAVSSIIIFLICSPLLAGCSEVLAKKEPIQLSADKVYEILKDQSQKDKYTILDVRAKEEFDLGHLDSAILIPVDELEARFGELSKDKPVIVYCRSGKRSATAAAILVSKGFPQVYDMTGGINAWTGKGYPVVVESAGSDTGDAGSSDSPDTGSTAASDGQTTTQGSTQEPENTASTGETSVTEGVRYVTADELNAKVTNGEDIVILDVRSEDSYALKHIKGAINIPYTDFEGRTGELDSSKVIILYCSSFDCGLSANAATMLTKSGFKNVFALKGGIESWQTEGYPVE
jgi:rhodanese-related sulfurtransferase